MKALFLAMCRTGSGSIKEAIKKSGSDEISFVDGVKTIDNLRAN